MVGKNQIVSKEEGIPRKRGVHSRERKGYGWWGCEGKTVSREYTHIMYKYSIANESVSTILGEHDMHDTFILHILGINISALWIKLVLLNEMNIS